MAFELYPGMAGAKKICQQLGMEHLLLQNGKRSQQLLVDALELQCWHSTLRL